MTERRYSIEVHTEAAMALPVRVFVAEAARQLGLDDTDVEDLRLLATELLGNAIDTGGATLELSVDAEGGAWVMEARGVGPLDTPAGPIDRGAILTGLAEITEIDGVVRFTPVVPL